jgi:anti-sigma B factor antagonist
MTAAAHSRSPSPTGGAPWSFRVVSPDPLEVAIGGELDTLTGPLVGEQLAEALKGSSGPARLDITEISFIDSQGLATLIEAHRLDPERSITLVGPRPNVRRLIEITRLDQVFGVE